MNRSALIKQAVLITLIAVIVIAITLPSVSCYRHPDPDRQARFIVSIVLLGLSTIGVSILLIKLLRHRQDSTRPFTSSYKMVIFLGCLVMYYSAAVMVSTISSDRRDYQNWKRNCDMHCVTVALQYYCEDNGGKFPPAHRWRQAVEHYAVYTTSHMPGGDRTIRVSIANPTNGDYSYGLNGLLGSKRLDEVSKPDKTIMAFESTPDKTTAFGSESFPIPKRGSYRMIGFVDGGIAIVRTRSDLASTKWNLE